MHKTFSVVRYSSVFRLSESVFRGIVNRSRACPPSLWRAGLFTISRPRRSQRGEFTIQHMSLFISCFRTYGLSLELLNYLRIVPLHKAGRTKESWSILLGQIKRFPVMAHYLFDIFLDIQAYAFLYLPHQKASPYELSQVVGALRKGEIEKHLQSFLKL